MDYTGYLDGRKKLCCGINERYLLFMGYSWMILSLILHLKSERAGTKNQ